MTNRKTSPALIRRETPETRIMLTRREFDKIIIRFFDEVKDSKQYYAFREQIFAEASQAEAGRGAT